MINHIPLEATSLGKPITEYKENPGTAAGALIVLVGGLAMLGAGLFTAVSSPDMAMLSSLVITLGVVGVYAACALLRGGHRVLTQRVLLYPEGVSYSLGNETRIFRWDEVASFVHEHFNSRISQHVRVVDQTYIVTTRSGEKFTFLSASFAHMGRLARALEEETLKRLLPAAEAELRAGKTLSFGPVSADSAGVSIGDGRLGWSQIGRMWVENTEFRIQDKGAPAAAIWFTGRTIVMPNLNVLMKLAAAHGIEVADLELSADIDSPAE